MTGLKSELLNRRSFSLDRTDTEQQQIDKQTLIENDNRIHSCQNKKPSEKDLSFRFCMQDLRINAMVEFSVRTHLSLCGKSKRRRSAYPLYAARRARSVNAFNRNITTGSRYENPDVGFQATSTHPLTDPSDQRAARGVIY